MMFRWLRFFINGTPAAGGIFCAPASRKGSNLSSPVMKNSLGPILTLMIRFDFGSQSNKGKYGQITKVLAKLNQNLVL